jgi:hypothetical protein
LHAAEVHAAVSAGLHVAWRHDAHALSAVMPLQRLASQNAVH